MLAPRVVDALVGVEAVVEEVDGGLEATTMIHLRHMVPGIRLRNRNRMMGLRGSKVGDPVFCRARWAEQRRDTWLGGLLEGGGILIDGRIRDSLVGVGDSRVKEAVGGITGKGARGARGVLLGVRATVRCGMRVWALGLPRGDREA